MNFFDLHCDTPYECYFQKQPFSQNSLAVYAKRGRCFEKWQQVFAIWIKDGEKEPYRLYQSILNDFKRKLFPCPQNLIPYFAVEGGSVIEERTERIAELKKDGVRFFTLTWNGENRIAGDLSHLNDQGFYDAVSCADFPVATHSNCRSVCNVPRNLKDDQIRLIAQKGGLIGLCFYPSFLCGEVLDALYCNIRHLCKMGLEEFIAVGSDFDGAEMAREVSSLSDIPFLYVKLNEMGIQESILRKVFYENADRYIKTFDKRKGLG